MRRTHAVEITIPRHDVLIVEPGAHDIAELEIREPERPFEIAERLLRLRRRAKRRRRGPQSSDQAVPRRAILEDRRNHALAHANSGHMPRAHRKRLETGERRLRGGRTIDPG